MKEGKKKRLHRYVKIVRMLRKSWSIWSGYSLSVGCNLVIKDVAGQQEVDELLLNLTPAGSVWWRRAGGMPRIQCN